MKYNKTVKKKKKVLLSLSVSFFLFFYHGVFFKTPWSLLAKLANQIWKK